MFEASLDRVDKTHTWLFVELTSGFMLFEQKHCDSTVSTCWAPNCTNNMIQRRVDGKWCQSVRLGSVSLSVLVCLFPHLCLVFWLCPPSLITLILLSYSAAVVFYWFLSALSPAAGVTSPRSVAACPKTLKQGTWWGSVLRLSLRLDGLTFSRNVFKRSYIQESQYPVMTSECERPGKWMRHYLILWGTL